MKGWMGLYIQATITENGRVIKKTHRKRSRSYLKQMLQMIAAIMEHTYATTDGNQTIKDTGNADRTMRGFATTANQNWAGDAAVNDSTYGVVVGTDNTAPTNTDVTLVAQVVHGGGAGQLSHGAHTFTAPAVVGANIDYIIQRTFINNSGGAIAIEEAGIYMKADDSTAGARILCVIRDLLSISVANGQTLTVTYTLRTTV